MRKYTQCLLFLLLGLLSYSLSYSQAERKVSGIVRDSTGQGIPGISVNVKGKKTSAVTDGQGRFTIPVSSSEDVLEFTSIGYQTQDMPVGDNTNITVNMKSSAGNLNEVVVTAMGIRREQRKLGYATSTITAQEIIKTAPTNFASALYGKAPGVTVTTNPGGATSAVSVQIRGINSLSFQRQPLLVVDGVVIRNGDANNEGYWGGNQRVNGNGLLDINPENIESINILKGAAASALYGSDATFGVIVITTKSGRKSNGLGIDVNISGNTEQVAVTPDLQTEYGPGYDRATNMSAFGADDQGWIHMQVNGQDVVRPISRAYGQFGPKVDGRNVYWWDGTMRPYVSQPNNWKQYYRTGYSTVENIALSNATDKFNYRFSYTRNDYQGIQIGGYQKRNTFNLNTNYRISNKLSTDLVVSYTNEFVHNRPRQEYYLTNNYGGFFSPVDYMDMYFDKYQTSKGYKWVDWNQTQLDPAEALKYNIRAKDFLDFLWNQLANSYDETTNRLVGSATVNYNILPGLNLRGRWGTDYTGYFLEEKDRSTQPIAYGATGFYGTGNNRYLFTYGDVLLTYSHKIIQDLNATISAGYQGRKEDYRYESVGTRNGLTTENWFSMNASAVSPPQGNSYRQSLVKDGLFGILSLDYHNYLFVEGTLRRERTSTLYPGLNTFNYPGVSAAFELSNALKLPTFVNYSKLRAAWGIVGNPPGQYISNVVYSPGNVNGIPTLMPNATYGNQDLKNEQKHELEFGWQSKFLDNRLGFDVTYYNNKIVNQILYLTIPSTVGATSQVVNVGNMRNYGLELSLTGTPVRTKNVHWDVTANMSFNRNKILTLMEGLDQLTNANLDNGSILVVSKIGQPAGDIMGYKIRTNEKGQNIVNSSGYYDINFDEQQKLGNVQPKVMGGLINNIGYKNFSLNFLVDVRWGGQGVSQAYLYATGAGLFKNSLYGRDAEHGGIAYYTDASGKNIPANGLSQGPNQEKVYHDGYIINGVTSDNKTNTTIITAPDYYLNTFTWGSWPGSGSTSTYQAAVFDNNFIKMRELSLSYVFPVKLRSAVKAQNLTFTLYGRNLFYFYKSVPDYDPEGGVGTNYINQAISIGQGTAATRSYGASLRVTF